MDLPQNLDSKFRFILLTAKRARQLAAGAKPLVQSQHKKSTRVAQQEVEAGLVPFEILPLNSEDDNEKGKKGKNSK